MDVSRLECDDMTLVGNSLRPFAEMCVGKLKRICLKIGSDIDDYLVGERDY